MSKTLKIKNNETLSEGLLHPISVETLTKQLQKSSMFDVLNVSFEGEEGEGMNVFLPVEAQKKMHIKLKREFQSYLTLLMVVYSAPKDEWELKFFGVPAAYQTLAEKFLVLDGIDVVRDWLELPASERWKSGHQMFILGINDSYTEYCTFEIHNTTLIYWKKNKLE